MSHVAVEKLSRTEEKKAGILHGLRDLDERIRARAFHFFELRGGAAGHELDDWLRAEQELVTYPQSELIEKNGGFSIRLNTPGFKTDEVKVIAFPDALVVRAESNHECEKKDGKIHYCEFDRKTLFRQYPLPEAIAVDKVTADLDNGVLQVTAAKAKPEAVARMSAAA